MACSPITTMLCSLSAVGGVGGSEGPRDASFQSDPEHYEFSCLSIEEAWNFLDAQARDASREVKVQLGIGSVKREV